MKRQLGPLLLLACLPAGAFPLVSAWSPTPAVQSSGPIANEPVVVYSLSGGTLTGTLHRQLTVYNSGFVTLAKLDQPVFPTPGEVQEVRTAQVGPEGATQLLIDLVQAGAVQLEDQPFPVSDTPLKTLTVLEGKTFALSRTFSWRIGGDYLGVDEVLGTFIEKIFPGF